MELHFPVAVAAWLLASSLAAAATAPVVCPAGVPIGNIDLRVSPADGAEALPLKTINRLGEGDTIVYKPVLRSSEIRKGEVAIVLVAAVHRPGEDNLTVLEPKPAGKEERWQVPSKSSVAAFVYGPAGLSRSKVKRFLAKDDDLVAELADYAEKTAQTEALISALSSDETSGATVNAALTGFASQYGSAVQIDRTLPQNQQALTALRTLNPAVATYDPISPQSSQVIGQTASLATSVAALFFGSPVGLAAGGTALVMEMHSLAFPNTVFRSSFAQPIPNDGLGLCGRRDAVPPHSKIAYLWATRVPNIGPPHILIAKTAAVPLGMKMPVPVEVAPDKDAKYLVRTGKWFLEGEHESAEVPVHDLPDAKVLEIDLTHAKLTPGKYKLQGRWDWDKFAVAGDVSVASLSDFGKSHLAAESQDRLISKVGRVPLSLEGDDFEFVTKVELEKPGDKFFTAMPVPFVLPGGFRQGLQDRIDLQINTADLDPGDYRLMVIQADNKSHPVPVAILPVPPKIENFPAMINRGDTIREITLKGHGLERVAKLDAPGAKISLEAPSADGTERKIWIQLDRDAATGASFDLREYVENRSQPISLPGALRVVGPRPQIKSSRLSMPTGVDVSLHPGELPSGYVLSALLQVVDLTGNSSLTLGCRGEDQPRLTLNQGLKTDKGGMEQLGPGQVFVTFDDGVFPNGCELVAATENAAGTGGSDPYALGKVVRVPKIESIKIESIKVESPELSDPSMGSTSVDATLSGRDLETIDRAGWDPENGTVVADLPTPVPGETDKQELRITLSSGPPSPDGTLYVWLRGENAGRASAQRLAIKPTQNRARTKTTANVEPAPAVK